MMDETDIREIKKSLAHIESLLQRMPEMIAAAYLLVKEEADIDKGYSYRYAEVLELPEVNQR